MSGEPRGGEFYDDDAVRRSYLEHRHDGVHSPNRVMEEPALFAAVGDLRGARVLDLGCGDGSTAPTVLAAGVASYVGIDGSAGMIEEARVRNEAPGVRFVHGDIEDLAPDLGTFDVVISRMALHYIADLAPVFGRIHQTLTDGGKLVFSVVHPVITSHDTSSDGPRTTWTVDQYFVRSSRERSWFGSTVRWHHRTIEDHVRLLTDNGFQLETLSECEPSAELLAAQPDELERRRRVPLMLVLGATKRD